MPRKVGILGNKSSSPLETNLQRLTLLFPPQPLAPSSLATNEVQTPEIVINPEADQPIARQQFGTAMVKLAMTLFLKACFRYRVVPRIFEALGSALACCFPVPCFSTVRLWMLRLGLHRLHSASVGPRWALICDHTATYSGQKLFVVCGVDLDKLEQRIAEDMGDYNLTSSDLVPLALVPMSHSYAECLLEIYQKIIAQHGNPERMITDGGSDICKSMRLLNDYQVANNQALTAHTYDLSHQIARIVQSELENMPEWVLFEKMATAARICCKYKLRHLSPPSLRHGPDRWMNVGGIVRWYTDMLLLRAKRATISQEAVDESQPPKHVEKPRYGLTNFVWERGNAEHNKPDGHYYALQKLCGREYADEAAYMAALVERRSKLPIEIQNYLRERSDLNNIYLEELLAGSAEVEGVHSEVKGMLAFNNEVQARVKSKGLAKADVVEYERMLQDAKLSGVGLRVGARVVLAIKDMAAKLGDGDRIVVTSDVIESLNGSWKMLNSGGLTPALGGNALLMAALMGTLTVKETKLALETEKVADVIAWIKETYGQTFHEERRHIRRVESHPNMGEQNRDI
jgi:hypothetical protein